MIIKVISVKRKITIEILSRKTLNKTSLNILRGWIAEYFDEIYTANIMKSVIYALNNDETKNMYNLCIDNNIYIIIDGVSDTLHIRCNSIDTNITFIFNRNSSY